MKLSARNKIEEGTGYLQSTFSKENINKATDCIWEAIRIIRGDGLTKTYYLNCPDTSIEYNDIKIALDKQIDMYVGDELGMVSYLIPHTYMRSNPYKITTSDYTTVDVEGYILTAKKEGSVTITVTSMNDKHSDTITVNVIKKENITISDNEIYTVDINKFNFIENDYSYRSSLNNNSQFYSLLRYCNDNNIKKVIFPVSKKYYFETSSPLTVKNNIEIDLNNSEFIISPNHYRTYEFLKIKDEGFKVNILDGGYCDENGNIYEISKNNSIDTGETWLDENNVKHIVYIDWFSQCSYNIPTTDTVYLSGNINVKDAPSNGDYYRKYIERNKKYKVYLDFTKYKTSDYNSEDYTVNTIQLIAELFLNDTKIGEKVISSKTWNIKYLKKGSFSNSFTITEECDYIKIKITGLSDVNYPTTIVLGEPLVYLSESDNPSDIKNIIFKNGFIRGDGYVFDEQGNNVKDKIMQECYGSGWGDVNINGNTIESSNTLCVYGGQNIVFDNCYIGDSPGFNISIGNCVSFKDYYPNANNLEYGDINIDNGQDVESSSFARSSLIDVHEGIALSNQIMITDPAHASIYYYKYSSRLISVYFYDETESFINCQLYKLRHGILTIPDNTYYIRLVVPLVEGGELITSGNGDFNNSIFNIKFTKKNRIEFTNCEIAKNYSCGMAHSGNGVIINNCNFHDNIGRMPWCDIDSEDGWEKMQNNIFIDNIFDSYYGVILCAGINYVFKNNTFKDLTAYDNTHNIKLYGNTFITGGYPTNRISCQGDNYFINNTVSDTTLVTSSVSSQRECCVNVYNNNISNTKINFSGNNGDNNYSNTVTVLSKAEGLTDNFIDIKSDVSSILYSYTPINNSYFSDVSYCGDKNLVFNNCTILKYPDTYYGGNNYTHTFNNCTIYNAKESSYYIYNDCNFINDVVDNNVVGGMVKSGMTFAALLANGKYIRLQEQKFLNLFNNPFSLVAKVTKVNNWNCNLLTSTDFTLGTKFDGKIVVKLQGTIESSSKQYLYNTTSIGEKSVIIYQLIYNKENIKVYIDDSLLLTINIDSSFVPDNTNEILNIDSSQCSINNFYLYDRSLLDEEIMQNYNALI